MAFIPAPNCAQVDMIFTYGTSRIENVFHVKQESPYDQTSLAVLAALFKDWWSTRMKQYVPSGVSLTLIVARALDSETAPAIEFSTGLPLAGSDVANEPLPANATASMKWTTALRGRSYRGRTYHVGLKKSDVVGNSLIAQTVTDLIAAYNYLLTELEGLPADLVVLSKFSNKVPRVTAVATEIQAVTMDGFVDSQRRRLTGRGQ